MVDFSKLQQTTLAVGGIALINAVTQATWNNRVVRVIALLTSIGGVMIGTAAIVFGLFVLIVPFTYDSPYTWDEPDGIAYQASICTKDGLLLTTASSICVIINSIIIGYKLSWV